MRSPPYGLLVFLTTALVAVWPTAGPAGPVSYVIELSVDGLGSPYLQSLVAGGQLPNFQRLENEGAWTLNARCDYDISVTMPNHISMVTARGVYGTGSDGHGWTTNSWNGTATIQSNNGGVYVPSAFDVVHDAGLTSGMWAGKTKLGIIPASYSGKVDYSYITDASSSPSLVINDFLAKTQAAPYNYNFVHLGNPDFAGSWGGTNYLNAVKTVDGYLGSIFTTVANSAGMAGKTAIIITADHGGFGNDHSNAAAYSDYTIPFLVWGPGVSSGMDLYGLNSGARTDPGAGRPDYAVATPQPIRNSDSANLAMKLLGLDPVTGSTVNASQNLSVSGNAPAADVLGYTSFNECSTASTGVASWTPSASNSELAFSTANVLNIASSGRILGAYDSTTSPRRFRFRGVQADTTFAAVDLSGYDSRTASIDVLLKSGVTYADQDYYKASLSNGLDTLYLADVEGAALNSSSLTKDVFLHYSAAIPDSWTEATLTISSHIASNSGNADFDNFVITGTVVPEPSTLVLLAIGCLAWALRRRKAATAR
jgi:hypothetical protein